jgi:hypothetical protein
VGVGGSCALACSSNIAMRPCDLRPACGRQRECVSAPHRKHEESSGSERGLPQSRLAAGVGVAVRLTTWLVRTIPFNTARHWLQKPCGARQTQSLFCLQKQKIPVSVKTREATGDPVCLVCLGGRSVLPAAMLQSARCLLHCCLRRFCRYSVRTCSHQFTVQGRRRHASR